MRRYIEFARDGCPEAGRLVLGFLAPQVVEDRLDDEVVHGSIPLLA
jgi:hypothetical protein